MKLDEIYAEWKADSVIDPTALGDESLAIPVLHHKYYGFLTVERMLLRKLEAEGKKLRLAKYEHYTQGPSKEDWKDEWKRDWKTPSKGTILKNEVNVYLDGDEDLINHGLRIEYQREKVELLENVIKVIHNRSFHIESAIQFLRFTNGG
jgi:hypothetical protein